MAFITELFQSKKTNNNVTAITPGINSTTLATTSDYATSLSGSIFSSNTSLYTDDIGDVFMEDERITLYLDGTHKHKLTTPRRSKVASYASDIVDGKSITPQNFTVNPKDTIFKHVLASKQRDIMESEAYNDTLFEKYGKVKEIIGCGSYGTVKIAVKKDNQRGYTRKRDFFRNRIGEGSIQKRYFAVKEFNKSSEETYGVYNERVTREFSAGNFLDHPNIVKVYDLFVSNHQEYFQVMEYCECGNLKTLLKKSKKLDDNESNCFIKQILQGVEYMHSRGIAHRDLKPENILITSNGTLKITDFGTSEAFISQDTETNQKKVIRSSTFDGTCSYISPEGFLCSSDPRKQDIWSIAIIYYYISHGHKLWQYATRDDPLFLAYIRCCKKHRQFSPFEKLSEVLATPVLYQLLALKGPHRPSAKQVLASRWLQSVNCHHHV